MLPMPLNLSLVHRKKIESGELNSIQSFRPYLDGLAATVISPSLSFKFVPPHREFVYEYVGTVKVEAQAPWDEVNLHPPTPTGWKVRGTLKLQRVDTNTIAAAVSRRRR